MRRGARQIRALGEEAVAGIDRVRAGELRDADDLVDVQVRSDRMPALADQVRLVGLLPMQRVAVLPGVDRDGPGSELEGRAERPDGDLPTVGDQDLVEHRTA